MSSIFKTDKEINDLLQHPNNAMQKVEVDVRVKKIGSGNHGNHDEGNKKNGNQIRDTASQADIAVLAEVIGNKATSELTGVGETQVSQFKNGKNSNNDVKPELIKVTESRLNKLGVKAIDKVELFLELLTPDNMADMKAKDVTTSAAKMIDIYDKLHRRNESIHGSGDGRPQIHFYAPVQMNLEKYATKEV